MKPRTLLKIVQHMQDSEEVFDSASLAKMATESQTILSKTVSTRNVWENKRKFKFQRLDEKIATFGSNSFGKKIHRNM